MVKHCTSYRWISVALFAVMGFATPAISGSINPPASAVDAAGDPVPTMNTLDRVSTTWSKRFPATERFEVIGALLPTGAPEVILDKETGLTWEASDRGTLEFSFGQRACLGSTAGGRMGWRLPTLPELFSLLEGASVPASAPFSFSATNVFYWTETLAFDGTSIVNTILQTGNISTGNIAATPILSGVGNLAQTLCVRGPQ